MKRLKLQTGSNIVEFAFILPLLLILVSGIVDLGIALFDKAVITNAAREGARFGMVFGETSIPGGGRPSTTDIENRVKAYLGIDATHPNGWLINFGPSNLSISSSYDDLNLPSGISSGDKLTVTVTYTYHHYVMLITALKGMTSDFTSVSVMRME